MKKLITIAALLACSATQAQDLVLQTRIEQNSLDAMINRTRVILKNTQIGDMLKGDVDFNRDFFFTLKEMSKGKNFDKFRDIFSNVFKLDLKNARIRIRIPKIGYELENLSVKPVSLEVNDPDLELGLTAYLKGLKTSLTGGIEMDLMIANPKTGEEESYLTAKLNPTTLEIPSTLEPVSFDVKFETKRDQEFIFNLKEYNLNEIPGFVQSNLSAFNVTDTVLNKPLSADSIQVNPVIVRLNTLSRSVSFDSFKPLIQERLDEIVSGVISKISVSLKNTIGPKVLKTVFSNKSKSNFIIENKSIYSRLITSSFSEPAENQLSFGMTGEICTAESYQLIGAQCAADSLNFVPVRKISKETNEKAIAEISENLGRDESDMVLSNRVLNTTVKANLWNTVLAKKNLKIGPKGVFIVLNKQTGNPEIYLDAIYKGDGKGLKKYLINEKKPLRFPLRISTNLSFTNVEGTPHLLVQTSKVVSTQDEIINGISEYGLESKLIRGFKKRVANMILEMSSEINGQNAIDLELPVLKESNIEKTRIEASANGRLNLFFKF